MTKQNTQSTKQLLEAALQNLPVNRHTSDIRTHIFRAINEIKRVEKREYQKAQENATLTPSDKWKLDLQTGQLARPVVTPQVQLNLINKIDEMIAAEKKKIEEINEKNRTTNDQQLLG